VKNKPDSKGTPADDTVCVCLFTYTHPLRGYFPRILASVEAK
jgi:hypothetical protein